MLSLANVYLKYQQKVNTKSIIAKLKLIPLFPKETSKLFLLRGCDCRAFSTQQQKNNTDKKQRGLSDLP